MAATIHSVTFDCARPTRVAVFWATALGWTVTEGSGDDGADDGAVVEDPAGRLPRLLFLPVPEGKAVKNRVHFDLTPADTMDAEVERLAALGARKLRLFDKDPDDTFTVMQYPEGNEFCVEKRGPGDRTDRTGG